MFIQEKTFSKTRTHATSADLPKRIGRYVICIDGGTYTGAWRDGKRHGHGTHIWASGSRYVGAWRDDKKHGHGTFTWVNGDSYAGASARNMDTARTPGLTGAATRARGTRTPCSGKAPSPTRQDGRHRRPRARSADGGRADRGHRAPLHCHIRRRLQDDGRSAHTCD